MPETATDLTSLNATLVGEFQKLHALLETQLEESRSESQQSFEDLGVGVQTLSEQGAETLKQVEETPLVSADEECEAEPIAPARRFLFRIPVDYEAGGQCGKGTLIDISFFRSPDRGCRPPAEPRRVRRDLLQARGRGEAHLALRKGRP